MIGCDLEARAGRGPARRRVPAARRHRRRRLGGAGRRPAPHGRVDGLVANAGVTWRARLADLDPRRPGPGVARSTSTGTLLGIQALTPLMTAGGSVVVVGSVAALTGHFPVAYTASKWALRGLAKAACLELGPRGIRVNTVHPGYIETPMTASAAPAFRDANVAETPLGRTGTVDEVAPLVALPAQRRGLLHHRRRDPRRRRHDRPRRRRSRSATPSALTSDHPLRGTTVFEYFPGNYVWNLGVVATLNSGGLIDEVDRACRPIKDAAAQGEDAGTPDFLRAWTRADRPARRPGRGGREGRAHPHRRPAVLPGHQLPVPGRADAVELRPEPGAHLPAGAGAGAEGLRPAQTRASPGSRSPTRARRCRPTSARRRPPTTAPRR